MPTPGTNGIVEVTTQLLAGDPPKDWCVNHYSVNSGSTSVTLANWQALADAVKNWHFATTGTRTLYYQCGGNVKVYDRADPKPRPEKGFSTYTPSTWQTATGMPPTVALCASFYSVRNLKRQRGRVYLPVNTNWNAGARPNTLTMTNALAYITGLNAALIALVPSWGISVHSTIDNFDYVADHFWVNDTYDTQRRRGPKESTRVHSP
jgi:hypothetical protein